jgi:hypothetical protein
VTCGSCGAEMQIGEWPFCPHGFPMVGLSVIDDQIDGGPRHFETMGHDAPFISTKSEWRREVANRGLTNVVKHDSAYYAKQRKLLDEKRRDLGLGKADAVSL